LGLPTLSTHLKQGEAKQVDISIDRGKNFDQDVTIKFEGLPQGVSIEPGSPAIKHGEKDVKVTVKASDSAALGDFTVKVTGQPATGAAATHDLKLTIEKK
jgi:uncharacterized membrane protein